MKRVVAILVLMVIVLSISATALAYPDGSDTSKQTTLPYANKTFSIKEGTQTAKWFTGVSGIDMSVWDVSLSAKKDLTLSINTYYYNSGSGTWSKNGTTKTMAVKNGAGSDSDYSWSASTSRKYCAGFSKTAYTSSTLSGSFTISESD